MDAVTAQPKLLKQANLSLLRKALRSMGTATRAELAQETQISSTTVRSLLAELLENREIQSIGYDASSGGRKAERYRLQPGRYHGAAICISDGQVHGLLVNLCGEIVETTPLEAVDGDYEKAALPYLDSLAARYTLKAIGVGVPGVVEGNCYWKAEPCGGPLCKVPLGEALTRRYGVPVVLENDLKATAIGFGRCYAKEYPQENPEDTHMAYLHFDHTCVSASFITGGRIIRGYSNFAGELGLLPTEDGRTLDDCISGPMDDSRYTARVIEIIRWICGILNPRYVALGGPAFRKGCIGPIGDGLSALLPRPMLAEILYAPSLWHDYHDGMAYLTAGKIFDEVQIVKE